MQKKLTVKELPEQERPYEKCLMSGPESLTDAELISIIIRTGTVGEKSTDLARNVLTTGDQGLLNLIYLSLQELMQIHGIGKVKAIQLKCVGELAKRISATNRRRNPIMRDAQTIAANYMEQLRHESREHFVLTMFDAKSMLLADRILTTGTSSASLVSPADIFREAIQCQCRYIVILHNHPSGDPTPSEEDMLVTEQILMAGELLDIPLQDHIIIGDNCYFSFTEAGILYSKGEQHG